MISGDWVNGYAKTSARISKNQQPLFLVKQNNAFQEIRRASFRHLNKAIESRLPAVWAGWWFADMILCGNIYIHRPRKEQNSMRIYTD